jgi:hypothetical protein
MSEKIKGLADDECEELLEKNSNSTDLMKLSGGVLSNINYKVAFMLFVISIVIFSDVFIDTVIRPFGNTVEAECTTTKGTMIQLLFLTISYILIDLIVKYEIL